MSEQILAKLDAIQTTIASLRAEVGGLQAQVSTKADCTAFSALSSTVRGQGSTITSQGGMISAQGQAITTLASRIDLPCGCNKAAATAETALDTTRIQSASGAVLIDFGKGVITIANPNGPIVLRNLDAAKGRQVFISEASVASAAIVIEETVRASADEVLFGRIGELTSALDSRLADTVRQILREELKPGGMLHRS
ncbi:hypothetical protein HMH05_02970 [Pseudomonas sp. SbB1]|uniref:DUF1983 domain-containing protein n=1 Tax=Pseudomonas putida (strain GB-1) TaxID=76869 RepID=B0KJS2_PSEPG|nr:MULTISPECIES: hypothetical protein [Pseudomonas]ABY99300.1 hypothetical protein PputGB1_3409 [Pseudomonas putida GB-1]MBP0706913.1 hypothetical protein [Pseudomonas sp. T34]MCK2186351.1 hypothetical protein [Pseudomonas sp. MB04B]MDD2083542.1 hypothetical protein [Pseudomonas putida]MDD2093556.1 hypothetical protein [Pseudomonas putida]